MTRLSEMVFTRGHFSPMDYYKFVAKVNAKSRVYAVDETTMKVCEDNPVATFVSNRLHAWTTTYTPVINDGKALVRINHNEFFILIESGQ